jgi:hypothetical protein
MAKKSAAATTKQQHQQQVAPVTALELVALETSRETLALLRQRVNEAERGLKGAEQDLIMRLDAGARVVGGMTAIVETQEGSISPKWKEHYLQHMMVQHNISFETAEAQVREATDRSSKRVLVVGKAR